MLPNEFLKNSTNSLLHFILELFNTVFESGIVPTDWTIGLIRPIYKKKGKPEDPNNYRGITLLSCLGKLFTAVLNHRLNLYLEDCEKIGNEQAGFRNNHSTLDHIFTLHSLLELYLFGRERVYCAFIDYRKAFDIVDRTSLWNKLLLSDINGNFFKVVNNMYTQAKSCVIKDGEKSSLFDCNIGVRQGENLSPLLFAMFINDFKEFISERYDGLDVLPEKLQSSLLDHGIDVYMKLFTLLYADDTIVLAKSEQELQCALNAVSDYCKRWYLNVNIDKTKIVIFSRGKVRKTGSFTFNNQALEVVDDYVYLGITFNYNNSFRKAQAKQLNQARRAMYSMLNKIYHLDLPVDIQIELFDQLVLPILLYGSEIWGFDVIRDLEVFHMKFCKQILKVNKSTANCMVLGELGRFKLDKYIENRMINFWCGLVHNSKTKMSGMIYEIVKILSDQGIYQTSWLTKIKQTLDRLGMTNLFDISDSSSRNWVKQAVDLRIKDSQLQNWFTFINENSQCINYRIFKENLRLESYLINMNKKDRITFCRFRCGNHRLPITSGRYENRQRNMRLCTLCNLQSIGDEFHYIFVCPYFAKERKFHLKRYYTDRPNTLKMNQLFNCEKPEIRSNLVKFCKKIMLRF